MTSYVIVKHGGDSLRMITEGKLLVGELMLDIEKLTNVHIRGQKLIHKGKVLQPGDSLSVVPSGGKLMLMATAGVFQGSRAPSARETYKGAGKKIGDSGPSSRMSSQISTSLLGDEKARLEIWKKTGQVSLRDMNLEKIPEIVWSVGEPLRVLDLGGNVLSSFPDVSCLTNLQRLRLSSNCLQDRSFHWDSVAKLGCLQALDLDGNQLRSVPQSIGQLVSLKRLCLAGNELESLPLEIGNLSKLEFLDVNRNKIDSIPESLSNCSSLIELSLAFNFIKSIPAGLGKLKKLKVLALNNNGIGAVPSELLKGCSELSTLSLAGNPITIERLREVDGWDEFDARRREKYNKQIEFKAMGSSSGFEEGADATQWKHW